MGVLGTIAGLGLIFFLLMDAFETAILPRRVTHRFRFARLFYQSTWMLWRSVGLRIPAGKLREAFLSWFGPMSLLALLTVWVTGLIVGFALLQWSLGTPVRPPEEGTFWTYLYWSGGAFFTLGPGDVTTDSLLGRGLAVLEAGLGFGFLALIIGYLPVAYQTFSRREVTISLLDARAGSPPSAAQLLLRVANSGDCSIVDPLLAEWERWAAELLESHLSFPVLAFYRSQHNNQSWLGALTSILDTCAFLIAQVKDHNSYQAKLTFGMARHALVDLALIFNTPPVAPRPDRLSPDQLQLLQSQLREAGVELADPATADPQLTELRKTYEPFLNALAGRFLFLLPPFMPEQATPDNWQSSAWMPRMPAFASLPDGRRPRGHFD
jgi:Ion channel